MKVNENTRFPHPVLTPWSDDFLEGHFSLSLGVEEAPARSMVTLKHSMELDQPEVLELISAGTAAVGVYVSCRDTYYSRLVPLGKDDGSIAFQPGELAGRVIVRPMIWARERISAFPLSVCHPEFGDSPADFDRGTVLALDHEIIINVGLDKLAQIETIFTIALSETLDPGMMAVELESEKIRILVAPDIHSTVNEMRGLKAGRPIVVNTVYLPAIMQVLDILRDNSDAYDGKRWHRVFLAKCDHLGINTSDPEIWHDAQKLLHSPFTSVQAIHEARK